MKRCSPAALLAAATGLFLLSPEAALARDPAPAPQVAVFAAGAAGAPHGYRIVGAIHEEICRKPWEMAPTQSDVVKAMAASARGIGADSIVDVRFDQRRLDVRANCWKRISAVGTAVRGAPGALADR